MVNGDGLVFGGDGVLSYELIATDGDEVFPVGGIGQGRGSGGVWWGEGVSVCKFQRELGGRTCGRIEG